MRIVEYIKLARPWQWYKNLVIFLPIFFAGLFFNMELVYKVILGFIALSLVSSANYVLNDIVDRKKDIIHPEKKNRPLASKKVSVPEAYILLAALLISGIYLAYAQEYLFFIAAIMLFVLNTMYSFVLKNEPIADILMISVNFVVRIVAGSLIIKSYISAWLVLCPFFLALLLAAGKRDADIKFVKNADAYKKVLKHYNKEILHSIIIISSACLVIVYSLYAVSTNSLLILTVPVATYMVLRYYSLIDMGSDIARHPERIIKDMRTIIALILYSIILFLTIYIADIHSISIFLK